MEQGNGTISENDLMQKLARARKVMNAVDNSGYKPGNINEEMMNIPDEFDQTEHLSPELRQPSKNLTQPVGGYPMNEEKIRNSKLPDAIKEAMIKNPIQQPNMNMTQSLDMKIFEGAKRLMNEDNIPSKHAKPTPGTRKPIQQQNTSSASVDEIISKLEPLIESTIRKVLDEKLTQILTAQQTGTINENLAIKVGDSIFSGKITKVKSTK